MNPVCYSALQLDPHWTEEGDSTGAHGKCGITPGTSTAPMKLSYNPAKRPQGQPWDNAYVLHRNPYVSAQAFQYPVTVSFPSAADIANCEALEFDFQLNAGSAVFNLGWQFLLGTGLRLWDRSTASWGTAIAAAIPSTLTTPGTWTRIVPVFWCDATHVVYLGIALNGTFSPFNVAFPAIAMVQSPYLNNAVQLDSKGQGAPINLLLNECSVLGF